MCWKPLAWASAELLHQRLESLRQLIVPLFSPWQGGSQTPIPNPLFYRAFCGHFAA